MRNGIYLDCETTGLSGSDRICELTMVRIVDGDVVDKFSRQYDPDMPVSPEASRVNGLVWERDLKGKGEFEPLEINHWFTGQAVVHAYSAGFDKRMLCQEFERWNMILPSCEWVDVLKIAKEKLDLKRYRQVDVAAHFGIDTTGSHSANRDVEILVDIARALEEAVAPATGVATIEDTLKHFALVLRETMDVTIELTADTYHDSVVVDSAINNLQSLRNDLERKRKLIVKEPTQLVRSINAQFKQVKDIIDGEKARLDGMVKGFLMKGDDITVGLEPAKGSAVRGKKYCIMYGHVKLSQVDMKFMKLDEFAVEAEVNRQVAEGIDPPRITGVPLELDYVVKRRAR